MTADASRGLKKCVYVWASIFLKTFLFYFVCVGWRLVGEFVFACVREQESYKLTGERV